MDTFSDNQSTAGKSRTHSLDSGVYVQMESNFDDSLLSPELKANNHKNNNQSSSLNANLQPEGQNIREKLAEEDEEKEYSNYTVRSDPDVVTGTAGELKGSTSAVIPEVDDPNSLTPLSMPVTPPPLPPKRYQRSPAFEKTTSQGPHLKVFDEEGKPMTCQIPPLCVVKDSNQCSDPDSGTISDIDHSCTFGTAAIQQLKCSPQPSSKPQKPPIKPPRLNKPKFTETEEGKQKEKQEAEQNKDEDKRNKPEQDLTKRNEKTQEHEETSGKKSHGDVAKSHRSIIVIFTDIKKGKEDKQNKGKKDEDPSKLLDRKRDEYDGKGHDRGNGDPGDTEVASPTMTDMSSQLAETVIESIPKSSTNQEVELPKGGQRLTLMPQCGNSPKPDNILETCHHSQLPRTQDDGQFNPGSLPQEVPPRVNPVGADSNMDTLKRTGNNKDIQTPGEVISKLSSDCPPGTEDAQETGETPRQINQKPSAGRRMKIFAKKMICKFKGEGRDEKRRTKAGGEEVTQDGTEHWEEAGMKEEEEWMDEEIEARIIRRHGPDSPFSSFKVHSPVALVAELLSSDEWSPFLSKELRGSTPDSPPCKMQSEDTAQPSENHQIDSSAELDPAPDVLEGSLLVPKGESVYEAIDQLPVNTDEQQEMDRAPCTASPQIPEESDAHHMSLRTKNIYDSVEVVQSVQTENTYVHFSDTKRQAVLDSAIQKYLIRLSKRRKPKIRKPRHGRRQDNLSQSPSSTSSQVVNFSIFYNVPS